MPANGRKGRQNNRPPTKIFDFEDTNTLAEARISDVSAAQPNKRARSATVSDEEFDSQDNEIESSKAFNSGSCDGEMQSLLKGFGADINKNIGAKRRRLQSFTQASLKTSNRKYADIFKAQQDERAKIATEFRKQISGVFQQWESDVQKAKESEEKIETIFKQQQKAIQQQRIIQHQRLKSLRQLQDQFSKSCTELEDVHYSQQTNIQGELKKELEAMQRKIIADAQKEDILNVRKSLQSMLSHV